MTKRVQAKYKISRRIGESLWGRGKDPIHTKNYAPGQHGPLKRGVLSDYGTQLMAKQKLKGYYANITEKQFRRIFKEAANAKGDTGENLIGLLESRLDAFLYRMNAVPTPYAARQAIGHKHILVNGKVVNIPSYRLRPGDVVQVKEKSQNIPMIQAALQNKERDIPDYVEMDFANAKGTYVRVPASDEVPYPVKMDVNLVIEFYSR